MPYYWWRGVTLTGGIKKGKLFARSLEHLDELLLKRHIALLSGKAAKQWVKWPIRLHDQIQLFQQLATLIDAGVLIPDALIIVANQIEHYQLQEKMHVVAEVVHAGVPLSMAFMQTGTIDNPIIIQLIKAGEESGRLSYVLDAICSHLTATQDFYRRLRSALLLPGITLLFFLVIVLIIFTAIMPKFIDIFTSMHTKIPPLTQNLLSVSSFLRSAWMGLLVSVAAFVIIIGWRLTRRGVGRRVLDWIWLKSPLIGPLMTYRFLSYSMRALTVLLEGGMPLDTALHTVRDSLKNHIFKKYLSQLEQDVHGGCSLSEAMIRSEEGLFSQDIIAMIEVGEESGRLPILADRVALTYHARVMQRLSLITTLLQPMVMIILGLLVALLIFAVYGPIFNMSHIF